MKKGDRQHIRLSVPFLFPLEQSVPRTTGGIGKSFCKLQYGRYIGSRYICIRKETEGKRGILLKVLGKVYSDQVKIINGEPFSKDESTELFMSHSYVSYPYQSMKDVKEVLDILRGNTDLLQTFEKAKMHITPNSSYWVSETARNKFMLKIPQVYDSHQDILCTASDDTPYYRITMVYFHNGTLTW